MSRQWVEAHLGRLGPHERRLLFKRAALYAQGLGGRVEAPQRYRQNGADIVRITLARISEGRAGYAAKDGDVLFFYWFCRCCRLTARSLQADPGQDEDGPPACAAAQALDDDTAEHLDEGAALAFLERRNGLDEFLALIKDKRLQGKHRAYSLGFPAYAREGWGVAQIAKALRVTADTVGEYRSRLREFLEEFELLRERRRSAGPGR